MCIIYIFLIKFFPSMRFFRLKVWHEALKFSRFQFLPIFQPIQVTSITCLLEEQMKVSSFIRCISFFAEILSLIFIVFPRNHLKCLCLDSMQLWAGRCIILLLAPIFSIQVFTSCYSFTLDDQKVFKVHFS
jgi:hypothetical protein